MADSLWEVAMVKRIVLLVIVQIALGEGSVHAAQDEQSLSTEAAASRHATYRHDSWPEFVHRWRVMNGAGLRLVDLEVVVEDGRSTYAGVWKPGNDGYYLLRYDNWSNFVARWRELGQQGFRLIDTERVFHGGRFWYYGVWRSGQGPYALYRYGSWSAFTQKWQELNRRGFRLADIDVSERNGQVIYLGVWRGGGNDQSLFGFSSWSAFVSKWRNLTRDGYQLVDMDVTRRSDSTIHYVGVWHRGPQRALWRTFSWQSFRRKWAELAERGQVLVDLEVTYVGNARYQYLGTFGPAPNVTRDGPSLKRMAQELEALVAGDVVGMSYAFSQHGQLAFAGSIGLAQRSPDPEVPMSSQLRSTIGSVTKTVSAVALYQLLDQNGLTVDSKVGPWLPVDWERGPGFGNGPSDLSFKHLLTHTSGIGVRDADHRWDGLRSLVGVGLEPGADRSYSNLNYAFLRLLIPMLWRAVDGPSGEVTSENFGERYLEYLNSRIIAPEGMPFVGCWPLEGAPPVLSYPSVESSERGVLRSAPPARCGGQGGLHMSAQELTRYADAFRYSRSVMSSEHQEVMDGDLAGWNGRVLVEGGGTAYSHGGVRSPGTRTCMMKLPYGITASVIFNSPPPQDKCRLLRKSFNQALAAD
ncbi:MAG: serine hydrolase [Acidobacteriota bacterium]